MNEKGSLFEYFWKGFNVSLISIGERRSLFNENNGLMHLTIEKLFDYLSFYETGSYLIGISAFTIYKQSKQAEIFKDLLGHLTEMSIKNDIANIEVRTKAEALEVIQEIFTSKLTTKGHFFIRIMLYNIKLQTVSNLHLIDTLCHPNLKLQAVRSC